MQESDVQTKYEKGHKRLNLGNNNEMAAKKVSVKTTEFKNENGPGKFKIKTKIIH